MQEKFVYPGFGQERLETCSVNTWKNLDLSDLEKKSSIPRQIQHSKLRKENLGARYYIKHFLHLNWANKYRKNFNKDLKLFEKFLYLFLELV